MKTHALLSTVGWSALWVCGTLALTTDPAQAGLQTAYTVTAFVGLLVGTGGYLKISREVC